MIAFLSGLGCCLLIWTSFNILTFASQIVQWPESSLKLSYSKAKRKRVLPGLVSLPWSSMRWWWLSCCFSYSPPTDIGLAGIIAKVLLDSYTSSLPVTYSYIPIFPMTSLFFCWSRSLVHVEDTVSNGEVEFFM